MLLVCLPAYVTGHGNVKSGFLQSLFQQPAQFLKSEWEDLRFHHTTWFGLNPALEYLTPQRLWVQIPVGTLANFV